MEVVDIDALAIDSRWWTFTPPLLNPRFAHVIFFGQWAI